MSAIKKRLVPCPNCKKLSEYAVENTFRPFCSERCKMIDLGVWASEGYVIPVAINPADLSDDETNALPRH